MLHRNLVNSLLILLLGGCTSVTRYGDATIHDRPDFPFVVFDSLYLPQFSLSDEATYSWKVRDLPLPLFPKELVVAVDYSDVPPRGSLQDAVILVEFRSVDGDLLLHQRIELTSWKGSAAFADPGWEVSLPLHDLPSQTLTNYDVVIAVADPSPGNDYRAWLHGLTKIGGREN